jgi:hypothetical protein
MRNPLIDWIKRQFPTRPSRPVHLKLEPGNHTYILLYDKNFLSRKAMQFLGDGLTHDGINVILVGCDNPTQDLCYLKLENAVPSPHAVDGEMLLPPPQSPI